MIFAEIVPRKNIKDYLIHDGNGRNAGLVKDPMPPLPKGLTMQVNANLPEGTVVVDLERLFSMLKLDVVTFDDLYRICEVLLRKEEANKGSIFRE